MAIKNEVALKNTIDIQGGFFTLKQAQNAGFTKSEIKELLDSRRWVEEFDGVYRLYRYPFGYRADLIPYQLWLRQKVEKAPIVFSHHSAVEIYELLDLLPLHIHMTVPMEYKVGKVPYGIAVHNQDLDQADIQRFEWLLVTTPVRTIIDLIIEKRLPFDIIQQVYQHACLVGNITSREELLNHPLAQKHSFVQEAIHKL